MLVREMWLIPVLLSTCIVIKGEKYHYVWQPPDDAEEKDHWSTYDKFGSADPHVWKSFPKSLSDFHKDHKHEEKSWKPYDDYILEYDPKEWWKDSTTTTESPPPPKKSDPWEYNGDEDPALWSCMYKDCRGEKQSPINIDTEVIKVNKSIIRFSFHNYKKPLKDLTMKNTGRTVKITIPKSEEVFVKTKKGQKYRLLRIELYWSNSSFKGSQHSVDSKHFPLEIVLLHLNTKYDMPTNEPDAGLAISILFQIKKDDNEKLSPIFDSLGNIKYAGEKTNLTSPLRIKDLFPRNPFSFIKYFGSLLHPPCHEAITWIVFRHSNSVSENQLAKLRQLRSTAKDVKPEKFITKNSRPIQDLNDRKIQTTPQVYGHSHPWDFQYPIYDWWHD